MKKYRRNRLLLVILPIVFVLLACGLYLLQNVLYFEGEVTAKDESGIYVEVCENIKTISRDSLSYYIHREGCYTSVSEHTNVFIPKAELSDRIYFSLNVGDSVRACYFFKGNCSPVPVYYLHNILRVKVID